MELLWGWWLFGLVIVIWSIIGYSYMKNININDLTTFEFILLSMGCGLFTFSIMMGCVIAALIVVGWEDLVGFIKRRKKNV